MTTPRQIIRVLLVDDHEVVRAGLRMLIESRPDIKVVGEATNRQEALQLTAQEQPDIILLDLDLGDESGIDIIPEIRKLTDQARILVLTGMRDRESHQRAVRLGAVGLVQKEQAAAILVKAIEKVAAGEAWLEPGLVANVLTGLSRTRGAETTDPEVARIASLTEREREVIALICEGLQNKAIGSRLSISETTVRHHLTSIFSKLGVETRLELVIYAYRNSLAKLPR